MTDKIDAEALEAKGALIRSRTPLAIAKAKLEAVGGSAAAKQDKTARSLATAHGILKRARDQFKNVGGIEGLYTDMIKSFGGNELLSKVGLEAGSEYEVLRTQMALFYTNATNGSRPTDKDFAIIIGLIPQAGARKEIAELMFDALDQTLTQAQSEGGWREGLIEEVAQRAGVNTEELWKKHGDEAKRYLDLHFSPETK